jgi:hypothetical protein
MCVCKPTVLVTRGFQFDELRVTTDCRFVGDILQTYQERQENRAMGRPECC